MTLNKKIGDSRWRLFRWLKCIFCFFCGRGARSAVFVCCLLPPSRCGCHFYSIKRAKEKYHSILIFLWNIIAVVLLFCMSEILKEFGRLAFLPPLTRRCAVIACRMIWRCPCPDSVFVYHTADIFCVPNCVHFLCTKLRTFVYQAADIFCVPNCGHSFFQKTEADGCIPLPL